MTPSIDGLACTVRGCGAPLAREDAAWICARDHSFNVARSGYVNLLQPQDRRSRNPGDSKETVLARRRLFERGYGASLLAALTEELGLESPRASASILDVGSGEGSWLASLARRFELDGWGLDISVHAVDRAARAYPDCRWLVANGDRRLPFLDASLDYVISIHGRVNGPEFARVLGPEGKLVVVVPAADDLAELRAAVQGEAHARERVSKLTESLVPAFELARERSVRTRERLDAEALQDLLATTYRAGRRRPEKLALVTEMDVTASHAIACYARRAASGAR